MSDVQAVLNNLLTWKDTFLLRIHRRCCYPGYAKILATNFLPSRIPCSGQHPRRPTNHNIVRKLAKEKTFFFFFFKDALGADGCSHSLGHRFKIYLRIS